MSIYAVKGKFKQNILIIKIALLVCEARGTVGYIDYAAVSESGFLYAMLHYPVVGVGVYTQVWHPVPAPIKAFSGDSVALGPAGKTVDCAVCAAVVQPLPAFDIRVCGVRANNEGKGPYNPALFVAYHIAAVTPDIGTDHICRWIVACPLMHVAVTAHYLLCLPEKFQHGIYVLFCRFAYHAAIQKSGTLIFRTRIYYRLSRLIGTENNKQIAYHCSLLLFVEGYNLLV